MNKWKRFQRKIKFKGKTYNSVYEACNKLKFSYSLALSRLAKGESVDNAFHKGRLTVKTKEIVVDKKIYRSLEEARRKLNPNENSRTVQGRYKRGLPIKKALGLIKFQRKDREKITFRGKTYESLSALARAHGTNPTLFIRRIKSPKYKYEFTIAEALGLKKITGKGFTKPVILEKKEFKSLTAAAKHYGLKLKTISERLLKGWSIEQAFELKKRKGHHPGKIGIVYIIKNKVNGKIYIGATLGTLANRWKWHIEKSILKNVRKGSIQEAISIFGKKNFTKKIIKRSKYLSELSKLERHYIKKYNSMEPNGYNLSTGGIGYGNLGRKVKVNGRKFNTLKECAKFYKINPDTLVNRLNTGWSLEEAIGLKKRNKIPINNIVVKIDGKTFNSVRDAAKAYGLNDHTVRCRIGRGWNIKDALKTSNVELSKKIKFRGRTFKSIRKLAKFYKVSSGTLAGKISRGVSIKKALGL